MLLGMDVSIQECRASGYVVVDIKHRTETSRCPKDLEFRITLSNPSFWPGGYAKPGATPDQLYIYDIDLSFNELSKRFQQGGEQIKSFCDFENCPIELKCPLMCDFVQLASVVSGYSGLSI